MKNRQTFIIAYIFGHIEQKFDDSNQEHCQRKVNWNCRH